MGESSSEMSAEEMTEALSLEEKPEASNTARSAEFLEGINEETKSLGNPRVASLQETPGEAASSEENSDQADAAENVGTAEPEEANANPTTKFSEKDPLDLVPYIEKYMKVHLERNYSYVGFVHSIDPITHSVILSVPKEGGTYQTVIIPGTSVLDITEAPCDSSIIPPKRKPIGELAKDEAIQLRKKKIISWLKENRLPVAEEGANIVFGGITLLPPYEDKDISTTNPLIALEVKKIIDRMPGDYQPK